MKNWAKLKQRLLKKDTSDEYMDKGVFKEVGETSINYNFSKLPFENASSWPDIEIPHF